MKARWQAILVWWGQLAPREQLLVGATASALFLVLAFLLGVAPLRSGLESAEERVRSREVDVELAQDLRRELGEVEARLSLVEARVRNGPRGNLFTILERLATQSAVTVASVEPQAAPALDRYKESKVQVALKGVTLAQAVNFLHRIESTDQLLSVKSLRLRTRDRGDTLDATFSVSSFEAR